MRQALGMRWRPVPVAGRVPWITCGLIAVALAASFTPGMPELLQYDRSRVEGGGEAWRLVTGQLVHWTTRMAIVDLGLVLLLGTVLERHGRRLLAGACVTGLLVTGTGIHLLAPHIGVSRGASGLATTLFVLLALRIVGDRRVPAGRGLAGLALALIAAKIIWEIASGEPIAAGPFPDGVTVLPLAHLLGAGAAVMAYGLFVPGRAFGRPRLRTAGETSQPEIAHHPSD